MADNSWTLPTRLDGMVTNFQIAPYEFRNAIKANSLVTWLFSKEQVSGSAQRLLKLIIYDTEKTVHIHPVAYTKKHRWKSHR